MTVQPCAEHPLPHIKPWDPAGTRRRLACAVVLLLLGLGAARMFTLVLQRPMQGHANNYDMLRLRAWFNLYPIGYTPNLAFTETPMRRHVFVDFGQSGTVFSSQMLLDAPAIALMAAVDYFRPGTVFDIRALGFSQALLILLIGAAYAWRFLARRRYGAALLSAAAFAALVTDPLNTLYLNGFYSDLSAAIAMYLVFLAGSAMLLDGATVGQLTVFAFGLALLGCSKMQHVPTSMLLGLCFVGAGWLQSWRTARRFVVALAAAGTVIGGFNAWIQLRADSNVGRIRRSVQVDSYFGAILPNCKNPAQAARRLGIPPQNLVFVGKNSSSPEVSGLEQLPDVGQASYLRLLRLFCDEPGLPLRLFRKGIQLLASGAEGWFLFGLVGHVEGASNRHTTHFSVSDLMVSDDARAREAWLWFALALGAVYAICLACRGRRPAAGDLGVVVTIAWITACACLFITIIGAGYVDYLRHNHLSCNLLLLIELAAVCQLVWFAARRLRVATPKGAPQDFPQEGPPLRRRLRGMAYCAALSATAILLLTAAAVVALRERPQFVLRDETLWDHGRGFCGTFDTLERDEKGNYVAGGWAYDPRGGDVRVFLACDGVTAPIHVFRGLDRPDVAAVLKRPDVLECGWIAFMPANIAARGGYYTAFAVFSDGRHAPLADLPAARNLHHTRDKALPR